MEFILPAVSKLKKILKDRVEVNIVEKLPFKEYEQLLEEYDIIIDQCKSYSYGMNAIFSMERGLVVLSGNEGESADYLGVPNDIVINIKPSINDIYEKLKSLVLLTDEELNKVRLRSIELVKQHHNPDIIAKEFVELTLSFRY